MIKLLFTILLCASISNLNAQDRKPQVDSAFFYYQVGEYKTSLSFLNQIDKLGNDSLKALGYSLSAHIASKENNFHLVFSHANAALRLKNCPLSVKVPLQILLSHAYFKNNKLDSSIVQINSALQLVNNDFEYFNDSTIFADLYLNLGFYSTPNASSTDQGRFNFIIECFDKAIDIYSKHPSMNRGVLVYPYLYKSLAYFRFTKDSSLVRENLKLAYNYYDTVSNNSSLAEISGYLFYNYGYYEEAIRTLANSKWNCWYAMALIRTGRVEEGLSILKDIVSNSNKSPYEKSISCFTLSEYYISKDDVSALNYFKQGKFFEDLSKEIDNTLSYTFLDSGNKNLNIQVNKIILKLNDTANNQKTVTTIFLVFIGVLVFVILSFLGLKIYFKRMGKSSVN